MAKSFAFVIAAAAILVAASTRASIPLYKQCDPRWGSNEMGTKGNGNRATICEEGCAMTSVAMGLAAQGVTLDGALVRPDTLNAWLEQNNGYVCLAGDCDNLALAAPDRVPGAKLQLVGENQKPPLAQLKEAVTSGHVMYIAHVHDNGHFVLMTGVAEDGMSFTVHDPFYNSTSYPYSNISDIIEYRVTDAPSDVSPGLRGAATGSLIAPRAHRAAVAGTIVPFPAPLYKQCDSRWGSDKIDTDTICQVGCLMSSTAMAIAARSISKCGDGSQVCDPGTLNSWLKTHHGYTGNDLIESAVHNLDPSRITWPADAMHRTNDLELSTVQSMLRAGRPVIANVMKGAHFVLVIGWDASSPDSLAVNDPGFERDFYSFSSDVVGWRLYNMTFH